MNNKHLSFHEIFDYLDKNVSQQEILDIEKHLSACNICNNNYLNAKKMLGLLSSIKVEKVPVSEKFVAETFKKYNKRKHKNSIHKLLWPVSAAAVFVFLLFSGLLDVKLFNQNNIQYAVTEPEVSNKFTDVFREYTLTGIDKNDVVKFVNDHNGKVLLANNKTVIVEALVSDYQRIRYGAAVASDVSSFKYSANLLTVGTKSNKFRYSSKIKRKERTIKFRINLK